MSNRSSKGTTIAELIMEYFSKHPGEELRHGTVVDWVEEQYLNLNGRKPRDTWHAIHEPFEFPNEVKQAIFERDGYRCMVCGRGREDGVELHADHKGPLHKGGTNTIDNGQTLCSEHNLLKKIYSQTEFGKRFLIRLFEEALKNNDERMIKFCNEIFDVYDRFGINSHIHRPKSDWDPMVGLAGALRLEGFGKFFEKSLLLG